jgi:AcrR family transcriptional regulator
MTPPQAKAAAGPRTPSPRRGQAREDAILAASFELIAEIGYHAITVDKLAARARASKSTMYRRWPGGIAEIVAEALRRHAEGRELSTPSTGSVRGDLIEVMRGMVATITGTPQGPSLLGLVEAVRDDAPLRDLVREQIQAGTTKVGKAICEEAEARGETVAVSSAAPMLRLAVAHILTTTLLTGAPPTKPAQRRFVDEILLPLVQPT